MHFGHASAQETPVNVHGIPDFLSYLFWCGDGIDYSTTTCYLFYRFTNTQRTDGNHSQRTVPFPTHSFTSSKKTYWSHKVFLLPFCMPTKQDSNMKKIVNLDYPFLNFQLGEQKVKMGFTDLICIFLLLYMDTTVSCLFHFLIGPREKR